MIYTINVLHSCGHNSTSNVSPHWTRTERDKWTKKQADRPCEDCAAKVAGQETIELDGRPFTVCGLLYGSEREVAWAVSIRKRIIAGLLKYRRHGENPLLWMEKFVDAKWWIQHREDKFGDLVRELKQAA